MIEISFSTIYKNTKNKSYARFVIMIEIYFNSVRAGWSLRGSKSPDLALIELNRYVEFQPGFISPICLPSGNVQDKPTKEVILLAKY